MSNDFYTILTDLGRYKIANAIANGSSLMLTEMAVGSGDNNQYYTPSSDQLSLKSETWRGQLNHLFIDPKNPNWVVAELIIQDAVGGFYIREVGVFDIDGDLIAIGKYPESYKPTLESGTDKQLCVRMILEVSNASSITLKVDPSVVLATREYLHQLFYTKEEVDQALLAVSLERAVKLDWMYAGHKIYFELFTKNYRLQNHFGTKVINGVLGDDSIDVLDSRGFTVGCDYILSDSDSSSLVRVGAILSDTRIRFTTPLQKVWSNTAQLSGSLKLKLNPHSASCEVGAQWISKILNLGESNTSRAVIIRRTLNAGEIRLYYRDESKTEWTEGMWSLRRQGDGLLDIPAGMSDYEYVIPMKGDGCIRIEVVGEPIEIQHIVAIDACTGLGGYVNPSMKPSAPTITTPTNNLINVTERPTISLAGFDSPAGNDLSGAQFQISTNSTFTTIVHDSGKVFGLSYSMPGGILVANSSYYIRARFFDIADLESGWSEIVKITTKATYAYVDTPKLVSPISNQTDVQAQVTLQSSPISFIGANDTHASSQWQIKLRNESWSTLIHDSGERFVEKTSYTSPITVLKEGQTQYVARVRHKGTTLGWSEWSSDLAFTTKSRFANIIGIVLLKTGGGGGTWQRVDENFNSIATTVSTFNNHPIYAGIVDQTIDGQAMVKIPKFYIRTGYVPNGEYAGKQFWMVSDQPSPGFVLHSAFMDYGKEIDQYWIGKYQGNADGSMKLGSAPGMMPLAYTSPQKIASLCFSRNVNGVEGFMLWSIYQLAAIQLLCLIEMGGADSQSLIGSGSTKNVVLKNNDQEVATATWRGIVGLWGNTSQHIDGLRMSGGAIQIWDIQGQRSFVSTGKVLPFNPYIWGLKTFMESGATFDLSHTFIPEQAVIYERDSSFPDHFQAIQNGYASHGGYAYGSKNGLFNLLIGAPFTEATDAYTSGRLAKV